MSAYAEKLTISMLTGSALTFSILTVKTIFTIKKRRNESKDFELFAILLLAFFGGFVSVIANWVPIIFDPTNCSHHYIAASAFGFERVLYNIFLSQRCVKIIPQIYGRSIALAFSTTSRILILYQAATLCHTVVTMTLVPIPGQCVPIVEPISNSSGRVVEIIHAILATIVFAHILASARHRTEGDSITSNIHSRVRELEMRSIAATVFSVISNVILVTCLVAIVPELVNPYILLIILLDDVFLGTSIYFSLLNDAKADKVANGSTSETHCEQCASTHSTHSTGNIKSRNSRAGASLNV